MRLLRCTVLLPGIVISVVPLRASVLLNGDFQSGVLAPWTAFTTANGSTGAALPDIVAFDTTGSGSSLASHFNVGQVNPTNIPEGGGISQSFTALGGLYSFSADIAAYQTDVHLNADAGDFAVQIDGTTLASHSFGQISPAQLLRASLTGTATLSPGLHTFSIVITRPWLNGVTPDQYVDNITLNLGGIPEPATIVLLGTAFTAIAILRRRLIP